MRADRYIIAREENVVLVDFRGDSDPPGPTFPGAGALRTEEGCEQGRDESPIRCLLAS
jgi:hypothetical protein